MEEYIYTEWNLEQRLMVFRKDTHNIELVQKVVYIMVLPPSTENPTQFILNG